MLRQFAAAFLVILPTLGAVQIALNHRAFLGWGIMVVGVLTGLIGWIWPLSIRWLFVGAMALAFPIGWVVSQFALVLIFYGIVTPVALFFRLIQRDGLCRRLYPEAASYWLSKKQTRDPRRYFRPY